MAKKQYYCNNLNNSVNHSKSTWKTLFSIPRPNSERPKIKLKVNNDMTSDPSKASEAFNDYFLSVVNTLASNIPPSSLNPIEKTARLQNTFDFFPTGFVEVRNVILSCESKKSPLNEIPSFAFKRIVDIISPILASLFNESVSKGVFPACLKIARVVPIHKCGIKMEVKN